MNATIRSKYSISDDAHYLEVIYALGETRGRASLDGQIVYVTSMLEGRRGGLEHAQSEVVRLQGEVQMFESLLETLRAKKTGGPTVPD